MTAVEWHSPEGKDMNGLAEIYFFKEIFKLSGTMYITE